MLRQALREAGRSDEVLATWDDLSCGPIESDDPAIRVDWWRQSFPAIESAGDLPAFWNRVTSADDSLVVWFGRHSAMELSFFLACADRLGTRPYRIVDVIGRCAPSVMSLVPDHGLRALLGSERPIAVAEREEARRRWRRLKDENAPFRIVSDAGLISTTLEHFDPWLLEAATVEWRRAARIVGHAMGHHMEPYIQVGDLVLVTRLVALVEQGRLQADGDPWDLQTCRVRLASAE